MRVEIAVNPAELVSLASRVAPAPQQARGAAQPRRGGRGGAKPREPRAARPKKTAEDLDAEMAVSFHFSASTALTGRPTAKTLPPLRHDKVVVLKCLCDYTCRGDMKCIVRSSHD